MLLATLDVTRCEYDLVHFLSTCADGAFAQPEQDCRLPFLLEHALKSILGLPKYGS